jgi:type II secretory pathway component PulF
MAFYHIPIIKGKSLAKNLSRINCHTAARHVQYIVVETNTEQFKTETGDAMISVKELAGWCRRAAIMLNAGLDIITVLERESGKYGGRTVYVPPGVAGPAAPPVQGVGSDIDDELHKYDYGERVRRRAAAHQEQMLKRPRKPPVFLYSNMQKICGYAVGRVREGATLYEAFSEVGGHFPKLFVPMIAVAERSGSLGETFAELARYYEYQLKLKREFWQMMIYPIFQLSAVVFIISGYILIRGFLGASASLFGMTFTGVPGVLKFLSLCGGFLGIVAVIYYVFKHFVSAGNNILHFGLNYIPLFGKAMRSFAMARFTWALSFTTKTGMDVNEAMTTTMTIKTAK